MSMIRWDPAGDFMSLRDAMNRLLAEGRIRPSGFAVEVGTAPIPIDMYQTPTEVVVKASIPGVKADDLDISVAENILTIKAEVREDMESKERNYLRKENRYGAMTRSITLPVEVQGEKANAVFENGILTLSIPKSEMAKPQKIRVQVKSGEGANY